MTPMPVITVEGLVSRPPVTLLELLEVAFVDRDGRVLVRIVDVFAMMRLDRSAEILLLAFLDGSVTAVTIREVVADDDLCVHLDVAHEAGVVIPRLVGRLRGVPMPRTRALGNDGDHVCLVRRGRVMGVQTSMLVADGPGRSEPDMRVARPDRWHHDPIAPVRDPMILMERVQHGDEAAFAELYDVLSAVVFGTVKRVLRDPAMSEEVAQEVFVELWRTAARFDPARATVSTWAVTLARRRAVDRVRREQSQRDRIERSALRRDGEVEATDDLVLASLDAQRVARALAELPDDQRQVIEMAFLDGDSHAAIAERLDLPLGTVKGRVRGGLRKLSGRLGGEP